MKQQDAHFRHILLYYFREGKNTSQAREKLCAVYEKTLKERQCQNWFAKFRSGDFSLIDLLKLMRPISRPLSIQIIIAQRVRLQRSSMYRIRALKKD